MKLGRSWGQGSYWLVLSRGHERQGSASVGIVMKRWKLPVVLWP